MRPAQQTYKIVKRVLVTVVGMTVLLTGLVLVFVPGPAIVVVPLGLGILSIEYAWARSWLKKIRVKISSSNAETRVKRNEQRRGHYPSG
ncbi:MAG: hypothetical protein HOI35_01075 [Woeseia sp.]|jgi:uncharacterized protein (TIGR02611 family)|nr:hypothetical protein [Woeseia sp.]MBT6208600.1 hypothetical protein [Woeseia sp.]